MFGVFRVLRVFCFCGVQRFFQVGVLRLLGEIRVLRMFLGCLRYFGLNTKATHQVLGVRDQSLRLTGVKLWVYAGAVL